MNNKILINILSILIMCLILAGASVIIINWTSVDTYERDLYSRNLSNQIIENKYSVEKSNKGLFFNITQNKPSSCHIINFYKRDVDKRVILYLNISKYTNNCDSNQSVVDTVSGEIEVENPESIEIRVDGKKVYFRNFEDK